MVSPAQQRLVPRPCHHPQWRQAGQGCQVLHLRWRLDKDGIVSPANGINMGFHKNNYGVFNRVFNVLFDFNDF